MVVDAVAFANFRAGNRSGVPSGTEKQVVERIRLSDDRSQLTVAYVVEDPEFLAEPMRGDIVWNWAPDRALGPFACDADYARRYAQSWLGPRLGCKPRARPDAVAV